MPLLFTRRAWCLVVIGLVAGCSPAPRPSTSSTKDDGSTVKSATALPAVDSASFVKEFLKGLREGKPNGLALSTELRKQIAPARLDSEKAQGWSSWGAEQKLKEIAGRLDGDYDWSTQGDVTIGKPKKSGAPRLIVRTASEQGKTVIDWLHVATSKTGETPTGSGDDLLVRTTTAAFLDSLCDKEFMTLELLLSPTFLTQFAPPLDAEDRARGFNRGTLANRLAGLRKDSDDYAILKRDISGDKADISGEWLGSAKRAFKLKLAKTGGVWKVDAFTVE